MDIMKNIAIECAPGTESSCDWMIHGAERHEQYIQQVLPVAIAVLSAMAIMLTLLVLNKWKRKSCFSQAFSLGIFVL